MHNARRGGNEIRVIETLSRIIAAGGWCSAESLKLHPQVVDFAAGPRSAGSAPRRKERRRVARGERQRGTESRWNRRQLVVEYDAERSQKISEHRAAAT